MATELLTETVKLLAKQVFRIITVAVKSEKKILRINERNIEDAIGIHLEKVNKFTSEISFKELNKPKSLLSVYIPLDLSIRALSDDSTNNFKASLSSIGTTKEDANTTASKVIEEVFHSTLNNVVLVGAPGSGKTTTIKFICQQVLTNDQYLKDINFPILIRLREDDILSNKAIPAFEYILNTFGIIVENGIKCTDPVDDKNQLDLFKRRVAIKIISDRRPLIIFDGLDEVADESLKSKLVKDINEISLSAKGAKFILTTRKGADTFHIDNTQSFEISPLTEEQIKSFAIKWLSEKKASDFIKQLYSSSVSDTAGRPLTLSHLCAIYENEGRIPERSRSIYRKIVNLLILEWNMENQINRTSKFSGFDADRKKEFLENLAFELSFNLNKNQFTNDDLRKCYSNLHAKFNLPLTQMPEVINEVQVHNGLITQTGYDSYEFAHKSFQEYLAAEYLVKLPKLPDHNNFYSVPSEIALAITLSSEPTEYFKYFIEEWLMKFPCKVPFLKSLFYRIKLEQPEFFISDLLGVALVNFHNKCCEELLKSGNQTSAEVYSLDECFDYLKSFPNINLSILSYARNNIGYPEMQTLNYVRLRITSSKYKGNFPSYIHATIAFYKTYFESSYGDLR